MALKVTSGAWVTAAKENQQQRDSHREEFFAQAGIKPAASLREVYLPLARRLALLQTQIGEAKADRIGDPTMVEAAGLAEQALLAVGLGTPSLPTAAELQPQGILALSPEVLKRFFLTDQETALERSLF
jgi:hypothetical protein